MVGHLIRSNVLRVWGLGQASRKSSNLGKEKHIAMQNAQSLWFGEPTALPLLPPPGLPWNENLIGNGVYVSQIDLMVSIAGACSNNTGRINPSMPCAGNGQLCLNCFCAEVPSKIESANCILIFLKTLWGMSADLVKA
eukprot:1159067-Pelagomonas_calceolata.AAC.4